jgi:hypothetical protein
MIGGFVAWFVGLSSQIVLMISYVVLSYSAQDSIRQFGWGRVPPERLSAFVWLSDNLSALDVTTFLVTGASALFLMYRVALILRTLELQQYFGPGLTTLSIFIPFYSFYRPWAGLGEVRNTLTDAIRERRLPEAGIRGANAPTVVYAISVFSFVLADKMLGNAANQMIPKQEFKSAAPYLAFLDQMSTIFIAQSVAALIFLAIASWYWLSTIRLAKDVLMMKPLHQDPDDWSLADNEAFKLLLEKQKR